MDGDEDDFQIQEMLGGAPNAPRPQRDHIPPRGENPEFDVYCDMLMDGADAEAVDFGEMRRAAWATWRTRPPAGVGGPGDAARQEEDDELARVLAMSVEEHSNRQPGQQEPGDEEEDEDLKKAIALSQQEARPTKRQRRDSTPEEERRMLAEAMAASLAQGNQETSTPTTSEASMPAQAQESVAATPDPLNPASFPSVLRLGNHVIDRAQMERERLERQAARSQQSAEAGPSKLQAPLKAETPSVPPATARIINGRRVSHTPPPAKGHSAAGPSRQASSARSTLHPFHEAGPARFDAAGRYFLDGEIRHTALSIGSRTEEPTFDPAEVFGEPTQIALIIICSFVVDEEWIPGVLPHPSEVPTVWIRPHPKEMHPAWNGKVQMQVNEEVRCYPEMTGDWGSAHMKFAWIFYKTGRLRVAIMTCNMVPYDWEWIENTVFVQDFLRSPKPAIAAGPNDFADRFRFLFIHLKVHKALRHLIKQHRLGSDIPFSPEEGFEDMNAYDWSRVRVRLVMSVPGTYTGWDEMDDFGQCRIGRLLSDEGWKPTRGQRVVAEYQGSSLGSYSLDWFDRFYQFCTGKDAKTISRLPKAKEFPPMKVLFPSLATVDASLLGREQQRVPVDIQGGGTMFCAKAFNGVTRQLFHDSNSKRGGVLMHAKFIVATFEDQPQLLGVTSTSGQKRKADDVVDSPKAVGGWVYIGSHNFSGAAWGTLNFKGKTPTLSLRNYELGFVFPLPKANARAVADVVVPYKRPARPYSKTDVPWDMKLHRDEGNV